MPDTSNTEAISLKEYIDSQDQSIREKIDGLKETISAAENSNDKRFQAQEKAVETAFAASKEAISKSETAVEKRADAVYVTINKLQESMAVVMPRAESENRYSSLTEKMAELSERVSGAEKLKQGTDLTVGKMIAIVVASTTVLGFVLGIIVFAANNGKP